MAITNHERVGEALEPLKDGLRPFVERELKARDAKGWLNIVRESVTYSQARLFTKASDLPCDATSLLAVMWNQWNEVFRATGAVRTRRCGWTHGFQSFNSTFK